jgi:hypothetical protein
MADFYTTDRPNLAGIMGGANTANAGGVPNVGGALTTMGEGMPAPFGALASGAGQAMSGLGSALGKGGKDAPADMSNVPMATGDFNQRIEAPARQQLLQAMMQRSRMGRNQGY